MKIAPGTARPSGVPSERATQSCRRDFIIAGRHARRIWAGMGNVQTFQPLTIVGIEVPAMPAQMRRAWHPARETMEARASLERLAQRDSKVRRRHPDAIVSSDKKK